MVMTETIKGIFSNWRRKSYHDEVLWQGKFW